MRGSRTTTSTATNAITPIVLHTSWNVVVEALMVEMGLPGLPLRPASWSR
jgi:hypothetical protein